MSENGNDSGPTLRELRHAHGLSLTGLADLAEIDKSQLSRAELGKSTVSVRGLERIRVALEIDSLDEVRAAYERGFAEDSGTRLRKHNELVAAGGQATGAAKARLIAAHQEEYERFLVEERIARGLPGVRKNAELEYLRKRVAELEAAARTDA